MGKYEQPPHPNGCSDEKTWPVKICLLGHFRLLINGKSIPVQVGGKTEIFLASLALKPEEWIPREQLVQLLWPTSDLAHGLRSLRTLAYNLHKMLGPVLKNQSPVLVGHSS